MNVELRIRQLHHEPQLAAELEQRVRSSLQRHARRVLAVSVALADENGPRGGVDKHCRVTLRVAGLPPVTVTARDASVRAALDRALARAVRAAARISDRRRARRPAASRQLPQSTTSTSYSMGSDTLLTLT